MDCIPNIERNRLYIKKPAGSDNDGKCEWQLKGATSLTNKAFKTCATNTKAALDERCGDPMVGTNPLYNKTYKPKKPISIESNGKTIVDTTGEYDADINEKGESKNMKNKYLKYKAKYIALKASIGGGKVYE